MPRFHLWVDYIIRSADITKMIKKMMTLLNTNGKLSPHDPGKSLDGDDVAQVGGMFTGLLKKSKEKW